MCVYLKLTIVTLLIFCRTSIFEDALAQVIAPSPGHTQSEGEHEAQSKLRFLSLLRRINELRSQQVDVSTSCELSLFVMSVLTYS